jgi:hypothetical protein
LDAIIAFHVLCGASIIFHQFAWDHFLAKVLVIELTWGMQNSYVRGATPNTFQAMFKKLVITLDHLCNNLIQGNRFMQVLHVIT